MKNLDQLLTAARRVYLDTNVFIYHLEDMEPYSEMTQIIFEAMIKGRFKGHVSTLGIMELNVGPYRAGVPEKAAAQTALLAQFPNLTIHPVDLAVADRAAQLRAQYRFKPPDAIHAATCLLQQCDTLIGNDADFMRLKGVKYVRLDEYRPVAVEDKPPS